MTQNIIEVVIDEGSNQIKTCWFDGEKIRCEVFPSRIVRNARIDSATEKKMLSTYEVESLKFTVADEMDNPVRTDVAQDYQVSKYNLILVHEALRRFGFGGQPVSITTTLPVDMYYSDDEKNQALIDRKERNLLRCDIANLAGQELATIVACHVKPESIPAWFDMILDDNGCIKISAGADHKIMAVDIGGTTTDITVIDGTGRIQEFATVPGGVYQIGENLRKILIAKTEFDVIEVFQIERALKTKTFAGENISAYIKAACDETVTDILRKMRLMKREAKSLAAVLYVGGGAALIGQELGTQYGGKSLFGDEFSIARGLLKHKINKGIINIESIE